MSKKRNWVIRGCVSSSFFNPKNVMSDHSTFQEIVTDNIVKTIETMKTDEWYYTMSSDNCINDSTIKSRIEADDGDLYSIRLLIPLNEKEYSTLRAIRSNIVNEVKLWAEKCDITGLRGWRLNAIKDPVFEKIDGTYRMSVDVILSRVIWYSGKRATVSQHISDSLVQQDVNVLLDNLDTISEVQRNNVKYFVNCL